jgi:cysteine synthase A
MDIIDRVVPVNGDEGLRLAKALATDEGIFVGISAGATLAGAMEVCKGAEKGTTVLCMLPDTGERYLSTPLFEDIPVDMSAEEIEIADSTPGYRFGGPPPPPPVVKEEEEQGDLAAAPKDATEFVNDVTGNAGEPVVMFSHEWCEFCWSVRKMFAKYEIPYRSVDLDSVEYQQDNKGGKIRAALREKTDSKTIPQIFIGGQFIGGATELFDAAKDGTMQKLLEENTVNYDKTVQDDPYSFLPGWLHKR